MARTPSGAAHEKVLEAAIHLIGERGIEGASMDAIAQVSGVSKATVYKHWKDKDALCIEVVNRLRVAPPEFRSGDPKRDLTHLLAHLANAGKPGRLMKILPRIIGYAAANPRFARALRRNSSGPAESQATRILNEAISRGDLDSGLAHGIDRGIAMNMLFGPILHSRLTRGKVPPKLPRLVVDSFWRTWGAPQPP
jgi:AcrR family transcriptional regulator